jgi:hypothetical protein
LMPAATAKSPTCRCAIRLVLCSFICTDYSVHAA